jgi:hypothetical protein
MGKFTIQKTYTNDDTLSEEAKKYREKLIKDAIDNHGAIEGSVQITSTYVSSNTPTIDNPLTFSAKDAFRLEDEAKNHYLRFGALLEFIVKNIIPITTDTARTPIIKIATEPWYQYMYSLPNQISLDPRVCLVRNSKFDTYGSGITNVLGEIPYFFKEIDNPNSINKSENSAYPLNIYLNFEFIKECLKADEKGNVSVYQLISNICTGLNKALGGINNLEPIIDEETNTLQIIDTTPIPGHSAAANFSGYLLQIYGYDKTGNDYISNFVRKVDLKTAITPEYATMITVGATAGGYVKGTEATAFSRWNTGLTDRFKEKFIPPTKDKTTAETDKKEPATIYLDEFAGSKGIHSRYGFTGFKKFKFSNNFIEKNISIVTEYYKWLIAKNAENSTVSGGTVGFIPFKLGLTLDGISGIKIYNVLRVNTEFLPKAYGKTVDLIVTGVSHRLNNNDWETSIESTVMPKTGATSAAAITAEEAKETLNEAISLPANKSLREVLISANYKPSTFLFELALAIGTKEGYTKGSKNRPSRNNNPGNLDGTSYKDIDPGVTLEPANSKGDRRFAKFTTPELGAKALIERKIKGWAKGNYPGTIVNGKSKNSDTYRQQYNVPSSLKGISGQKTNLTIEQFFYIYAPPSENNTIGYIDSIVKTLIKNYPKVTKNTKIIDYINK